MLLQYLCGKHGFETIFTHKYVMNIQYGIDKGFRSREIAYSMGVNAYFGPRRTNRPHSTPNYEPGKSKFEADYYRQTYCSPGIVPHIRKKPEKEFKKQCILLKV